MRLLNSKYRSLATLCGLSGGGGDGKGGTGRSWEGRGGGGVGGRGRGGAVNMQSNDIHVTDVICSYLKKICIIHEIV